MDNESKELKVDFSALLDILTATSSNKNGAKYTGTDIETYLNNPFRYHSNIRGVSDWFYNISGIYKQVINLNSTLATLDYMVIPTRKTLENIDEKAYQMYNDKATAYFDSINLKLFTRELLKSVGKYGGYVGYERTNGKDFYIQSLPLDYCRIKQRMGSEYQIEFNFKYFDKFFDKEDLEHAWITYPPEFKKLYNQYKSDKKSKAPEWKLIDVKKTYCVLSDENDGLFVPPYSGMFGALIDNFEFQSLTKQGKILDTIKMVVQEVPVDKDGNVTVDMSQVKTFHQRLKGLLPEGVVPLTTPMKVTDVSFSNVSKEKENGLESSERNVFINSGTSSALFADNGGHTGLNMNIEAITANIFAILEKVEGMFNKKLVYLLNSKKYDFKLKFYRTTNININESFERMYKLLSIGGAIEPLFSLVGFDVESYITLLTIENKLGIKDLLIVPQSMNTQSSSDTGGKPKKDEKDLKDEGAKARDLDSNNPKNRK